VCGLSNQMGIRSPTRRVLGVGNRPNASLPSVPHCCGGGARSVGAAIMASEWGKDVASRCETARALSCCPARQGEGGYLIPSWVVDVRRSTATSGPKRQLAYPNSSGGRSRCNPPRRKKLVAKCGAPAWNPPRWPGAAAKGSQVTIVERVGP
jgi:hypothetical protein